MIASPVMIVITNKALLLLSAKSLSPRPVNLFMYFFLILAPFEFSYVTKKQRIHFLLILAQFDFSYVGKKATVIHDKFITRPVLSRDFSHHPSLLPVTVARMSVENEFGPDPAVRRAISRLCRADLVTEIPSHWPFGAVRASAGPHRLHLSWRVIWMLLDQCLLWR
jgi:hypothetical protein